MAGLRTCIWQRRASGWVESYWEGHLETRYVGWLSLPALSYLEESECECEVRLDWWLVTVTDRYIGNNPPGCLYEMQWWPKMLLILPKSRCCLERGPEADMKVWSPGSSHWSICSDRHRRRHREPGELEMTRSDLWTSQSDLASWERLTCSSGNGDTSPQRRRTRVEIVNWLRQRTNILFSSQRRHKAVTEVRRTPAGEQTETTERICRQNVRVK